MVDEGSAPSVLVVDDEAMIRDVLRLTLVHAGYEVVEAENGEEALLLLSGQIPDLVLLDLMMPGMDGFAVCESIRGNPKTADLPIIIFSASRNSRHKQLSLEAGATKYLAKPLPPEMLLWHIREVLSKQTQ